MADATGPSPRPRCAERGGSCPTGARPRRGGRARVSSLAPTASEPSERSRTRSQEGNGLIKRFLLVVCAASIADCAWSQTSELYLTDYSHTMCYVVQNGVVVRRFLRQSIYDGPALVVQGTVKMFAQNWIGVGREYDYDGNLLVGQYPNPGFVDCYDGATDGARNWTIAHNDTALFFPVLVGDADWGNLQVAFVPTSRSFGIAYDPTDDTLWITNNVSGSDRVQHYTTAGVLLGEFTYPWISLGGYGIALDPIDQTLWIPGAINTRGWLFQFSKSGTPLQAFQVPGILSDTVGAEFGPPTAFVFTYCTAGTTTHGCLPAISATGAASASAPSGFTISVANVEGQKQGILFYGIDNSGFAPAPWGTSSSFLCVKAPVQRAQILTSGGTLLQCDGALGLDWNAFRFANPGALGSPFAAGDHVFAQAWFRDPPSPKSTMLSDAVEFNLAP
jgi:hypothetical protein